MKKFAFLVILLFCCLFLPYRSYAEEWYKGRVGCSYSEINTLRTLASAIKFEVKYLGNKRKDEYGIYVTNVSNKLVVRNNYTRINSSKLIDDLSPSTNVLFVIEIPDGTACAGLLEYTKTVSIPAYNYYYDEEICRGLNDLYVCDINYDSSKITEEEFNKIVSDYKKEAALANTDKSSDFKKEYLYICITALIIIIGLIFFFKMRSKKKRGI